MSTLTVAAAGVVGVVLGVVDGGVGNVVGNGTAGRLLLVPVMPQRDRPSVGPRPSVVVWWTRGRPTWRGVASRSQ
jgi:hypothetical protein